MRGLPSNSVVGLFKIGSSKELSTSPKASSTSVHMNTRLPRATTGELGGLQQAPIIATVQIDLWICLQPCSFSASVIPPSDWPDFSNFVLDGIESLTLGIRRHRICKAFLLKGYSREPCINLVRSCKSIY